MLENYLLSHIFPDMQKSDSAMLGLQMVKLRLGKVEQASCSESATKTWENMSSGSCHYIPSVLDCVAS